MLKWGIALFWYIGSIRVFSCKLSRKWLWISNIEARGQSLPCSHQLDLSQSKHSCWIKVGRSERQGGVWLAADVEELWHGWRLQYLAGVVVVEPAVQVDGVPAWHQAAVLENPQLSRGVVACGDDFMEGVFQRHRVVVSSLVLGGKGVGREQAFHQKHLM